MTIKSSLRAFIAALSIGTALPVGTGSYELGAVTPRVIVAALSLSAAGLVGIVAHEGYTDRAVIPVKGDVPTIGFGTTEGVKVGDKITPPVALARALKDTSRFEGALKECVTAPLHQYEFDAFTSLAYNIGTGAFCRSTLVQKLNSEDYAAACAEIDRWTFFKGKDCRNSASRCGGLVTRRAAERALCEGAL